MKVKKPKLYTCKYRPCRKKFIREREGQECCSIPCAMARAKIEVGKADKKENARIKREFYENDKTMTAWLNDLQNAINTVVRTIDYNQPCIATGAMQGKRNAGHYYAKNALPAIRFQLHNLHIQSEHSNKWKRGDSQRYKEGLIQVYGQAYFDMVEALSSTPEPEWTVDMVKEKITITKQIVKELKQTEKVYSTPERIELRFKYNNRIGIYTPATSVSLQPSTWGETTDKILF